MRGLEVRSLTIIASKLEGDKWSHYSHIQTQTIKFFETQPARYYAKPCNRDLDRRFCRLIPFRVRRLGKMSRHK